MTRRLLAAATLFAACADAPSRFDPPPPDLRPVTQIRAEPRPIAPGLLVAEHDVSALPGIAAGVTVEPDTGRRLVLMSYGAIHELGSSEPLWTGETGGVDPFGFTDVAALGGGRLALTMLSDGLLLDLRTGALTPHFCYEPGWWEPQGNEPVQLSMAVAHDARAGRLYAQPRTIEDGGVGAVVESFVAVYDEAGGADLTWWALPDVSFMASGMVVLPREPGEEPRLLLAVGPTLQRFDVATGELHALTDLSELGVADVAGLAIDAEAGTLLALDPGAQRIVELRLDALDL